MNFNREIIKPLKKVSNSNNMSASVISAGSSRIEFEINELLQCGECDMDSILRSINCSVDELNECIIMMELSGKVLRSGNIITKL